MTKNSTPSSTHKNGPSTADPSTAPVELEAPLDLVEVRADETLVEALRHTNPAQDAGFPVVQGDLAQLVLEWRREIDAVPFPGEPSLLAAASALQSGKAKRPRRLLTPVAAAAAAVGIALSGVALLAHDSQPGDRLWGVTQVVFSDHARSVVAATEVESSLQQAKTALVVGSPQAARAALEQASVALRSVQDGTRRSDLMTLYTALIAELAQKSPSAPLAPTVTSTAVSPTTTVVPPVTTSTAPSSPSKVQPPAERPTVVLPPPPPPVTTESPVPTTEAPPSPEPPTSTAPTPSPSPSPSEPTTASAPTTATAEPSSDVQSSLPNGLTTDSAPSSVPGA